MAVEQDLIEIKQKLQEMDKNLEEKLDMIHSLIVAIQAGEFKKGW